MNIENKAPSAQSEDIDLLVLIERSISFFRKYRWIYIIAILLGLGLGLYSYFTIPTVYKSRLIAHSSILTNQEQIQIIDNWNSLLKRHEYAQIAERFNCSENLISKLKNIEGTEIQKVFSAVNPNGFYIDVDITDNSILPELQKGIVYGLENGDYIKGRIEYKRARLKEMIAKITIEVIKLDSTKNEIENIISGKEKISSSLIIDVANINKQLIDINEKLLFFQEELKFTNGIEVLQGFSKFTNPVGPHLTVLLGLGVILTLSLAYIYTLISSIKDRLKIRSSLRKNP